MTRKPLFAVALAGLLATAWGAAQETSATQGFAAAKGRTTFRSYCASCHGSDASGNGSVAQYLSVPPADLTRITDRYDVFPVEQVRAMIDGRENVRAHGSREMPVWGSIFRDPLVPSPVEEDPDDRAARMIDELVAYLQTIQASD